MAQKDAFGLTYSGATEAGLSSYTRAVHELQCFIGDPVNKAKSVWLTEEGIARSEKLFREMVTVAK